MLKKVHLSDMRKGRLYLPVGKGVFHAEPTAAAQLFFARENRLHIITLQENPDHRQIIKTFEDTLPKITARSLLLERRFTMWLDSCWSILSMLASDIDHFAEFALDFAHAVSCSRYVQQGEHKKPEYFPYSGKNFRTLRPVNLYYE